MNYFCHKRRIGGFGEFALQQCRRSGKGPLHGPTVFSLINALGAFAEIFEECHGACA